MKERGKYQIQFMKTRSSSGVGQKVDLDFNVETLRITDAGDDDDNSSFNQGGGKGNGGSSVYAGLKRASTVTGVDQETGEITEADPTRGVPVGKVKNVKAASDIRAMIMNNINPERD
jgi:hypothetical protein